MEIIVTFQSVGELALKSKYLNSEYKKPVCIELEDVKIQRDLEYGKKSHQMEEVNCETDKKKNDDDVARYVELIRDYATKIVDYVSQLLPPTSMVMLQVYSPK
jgi:hypothetical protein